MNRKQGRNTAKTNVLTFGALCGIVAISLRITANEYTVNPTNKFISFVENTAA